MKYQNIIFTLQYPFILFLKLYLWQKEEISELIKKTFKAG